MKRTILLSAVLMLSFGQVWADLAPTVMLSHNGNKKFYMYDEIQKAVDDAVDGDTIYLSEGAFSPFNVDKRIMVRGAGETTIIEGDCEIYISGEEKLSMPVLDAMCFNGDVFVKSAYKQFTLRKCKMKNLKWGYGKEFYDVKFDRCWFTNNLSLPNNVKEINVFNSRIETLTPDNYSNMSKFDHCGIAHINDTIIGAEFTSCVVFDACGRTSSARALFGCIINSCYYAAINCDNCTIVDSTSGGAQSTDYSPNSLSSLDGTKKGIYGGQHPFTLNPEVPGVTKYNLSVDAANKKMTVNLTVDKLDK